MPLLFPSSSISITSFAPLSPLISCSHSTLSRIVYSSHYSFAPFSPPNHYVPYAGSRLILSTQTAVIHQVQKKYMPCKNLIEMFCHVMEASYGPSDNRWEIYMTCSDRSQPPCSYCWDQSQSLSPSWCDPCLWVWWRGWRCGWMPCSKLILRSATLWWCDPCIWVWWRGWLCGYGAPNWYCALPLSVYAIRVSGFGGEDGGVDAVPQANTALCHGWLVRIF
jgi:hypothetical protein